ncbi:hypothetical protein G8E10_09365 [Rhizobiaceae bacterium CRRU44]|uniref:Uncharacterized protein n=1 Tax=Ferranicluibacter rubi TaxID=2715133 RepID=A0AA44CCF4_9HYPH|nr:hypothetical protein [Ferranicluibacter rubi]NHT75887.1 hypothetical protein [Ferranicluibacter rubi]NHT75947.1 hypothetical protein [Ferranicluibacter rubi]
MKHKDTAYYRQSLPGVHETAEELKRRVRREARQQELAAAQAADETQVMTDQLANALRMVHACEGGVNGMRARMVAAEGTLSSLLQEIENRVTTDEMVQAFKALVATSPATLDTLKEFADAIENDPHFGSTMLLALSMRLRVDAAQTLTAAQLTQARANLGLGSAALRAFTDFATATHGHALADLAGQIMRSQLPANYPQRIEAYNGLTTAAGLHTVTFPTPFVSAPSVQPALVGTDTDTQFRIVSRTASGFSIHVFKRAKLTVLSIDLLSFATTNVAGAQVDVRVEGT